MGATLEEVVDVRGLDVGAAEPELEEVGEDNVTAVEGLGAPGELVPEAEVEAAEGGDAEDVGGDFRLEGPARADENEVVDALGREDAEPVARERAAVARRRVPADVGEADAAEGARVRGEDAGDSVGDGAPVGAEAQGAVVGLVRVLEEVGVVEDERRGGPDAAPARGERGGAGGVLDGEAGDDVGEQRVRQAADAVLVGLGSTDDGAGGGGNGAFGGRGDGLGGDAGEDLFHDAAASREGHRCGPRRRTGERRGFWFGRRQAW